MEALFMKKGFTLIELLIVMVILGVLVTIALPKYRTAMEKSRGTEGMSNLTNFTAAVNARYIMDDGQYNRVSQAQLQEFGNTGGLTKSRFFTDPTIHSVSANQVVTKTTRNSGPGYTLYFTSVNGVPTLRECANSTKYCRALGADGGNGSLGLLFTF